MSEASSIIYQQLSNQHNKTVTENQQLQLHLANTTKALAKSENDNRDMLEKFTNLELKVEKLLNLERRHTEDTEHQRTQSSSTTDHLDFIETPHKEYNFKHTIDNTGIILEPPNNTVDEFNESISKKIFRKFCRGDSKFYVSNSVKTHKIQGFHLALAKVVF